VNIYRAYTGCYTLTFLSRNDSFLQTAGAFRWLSEKKTNTLTVSDSKQNTGRMLGRKVEFMLNLQRVSESTFLSIAPRFRKERCLWKYLKIRPSVLLVNKTCRLLRVWSMGGTILTGKTDLLGGKPVSHFHSVHHK